jgi:hypothetical protein
MHECIHACMYVCICVCVCMCACVRMHVRKFTSRSRKNIPIYNKTWHAYSLGQGREHRKVKTPEVSRVRVSMRAVPVTRKLNTIEEQRQDQGCLKKEITETKARTSIPVLY